MNIKQSKKLMKLGMKAKQPFLLVGHSGLGKSQIIESLSKELFPNHQFVTIFAAQQEMGDFLGIPSVRTIKTTDENGKTTTVESTAWARPEWMPYGPCVLFLDEINNARVDVEAGMLQLVLEKRIHTHKLHPDSFICAAINPASAEYGTANNMTAALVKRFMVIPFEPEAKEFLEWASTSDKFNKNLLSFLTHRPDITGAEKKLDTLIKMEACPRLHTNAVSSMLNVVEAEGLAEDIDLVRDVFTCSVGIEAAGAYLGWLETQQKPVTFNEIITDPKAAIKKYNKFHKEMLTDLVANTHNNLIAGVKELHEKVADKFDYKVNLLEYDRNIDPKLVKACIEELNSFVQNGFCGISKELQNVITFMKELGTEDFFQVSHVLVTRPPFKPNDGNIDLEIYHAEQIKRFNSYNSIIFFMYRDDLIKVKGHKGLHDLFFKATEEVNKNKKKTEEVNKKKT